MQLPNVIRILRSLTLVASMGVASLVATRSFAADPAPAMTGKGCQVKVSGSVSASWKGTWQKPTVGKPAKVGAGTDYWLSDADLRKALTGLAGLFNKKSDAEKAKEVEKGMKKDPRLMLLLINCATDEGSIFLMPAQGAKYKDVPFTPKSYRIASSRTAKPGDFVLLPIKVGKQRFKVQGGTLDIKKFDLTGIAGSFSLKAEKKGEAIDVTGAFDFPCTGGGSRCKR